jgi:SAM-dependent methyltransferase
MSTAVASVARSALDKNQELSRAAERELRLPSDKPLWQHFERQAGELIRALPDGATAVDLGGGRRCVYAQALRPGQDVRLVAVDIDPDELAMNEDVAETCVANVAEGLPFDDGSVDLILSRALLEHVDGVPAAARHMARVMRPGGTALHLIPGRYSLFGTAARMLPFGPLKRAFHAVNPASVGQVEFDVHYDSCHPDGIERAFREAGFREVELTWCWAQPGYFEHVYPLFLGHALYERAVRKLSLRRLASYMVVRATR